MLQETPTVVILVVHQTNHMEPDNTQTDNNISHPSRLQMSVPSKAFMEVRCLVQIQLQMEYHPSPSVL